MSKNNKTTSKSSSKQNISSKQKTVLTKKPLRRLPIQVFKDIKPNTAVKSLVLYDSSKFTVALTTPTGWRKITYYLYWTWMVIYYLIRVGCRIAWFYIKRDLYYDNLRWIEEICYWYRKLDYDAQYLTIRFRIPGFFRKWGKRVLRRVKPTRIINKLGRWCKKWLYYLSWKFITVKYLQNVYYFSIFFPFVSFFKFIIQFSFNYLKFFFSYFFSIIFIPFSPIFYFFKNLFSLFVNINFISFFLFDYNIFKSDKNLFRFIFFFNLNYISFSVFSSSLYCSLIFYANCLLLTPLNNLSIRIKELYPIIKSLTWAHLIGLFASFFFVIYLFVYYSFSDFYYAMYRKQIAKKILSFYALLSSMVRNTLYSFFKFFYNFILSNFYLFITTLISNIRSFFSAIHNYLNFRRFFTLWSFHYYLHYITFSETLNDFFSTIYNFCHPFYSKFKYQVILHYLYIFKPNNWGAFTFDYMRRWHIWYYDYKKQVQLLWIMFKHALNLHFLLVIIFFLCLYHIF